MASKTLSPTMQKRKDAVVRFTATLRNLLSQTAVLKQSRIDPLVDEAVNVLLTDLGVPVDETEPIEPEYRSATPASPAETRLPTTPPKGPATERAEAAKAEQAAENPAPSFKAAPGYEVPTYEGFQGDAERGIRTETDSASSDETAPAKSEVLTEPADPIEFTPAFEVEPDQAGDKGSGKKTSGKNKK